MIEFRNVSKHYLTPTSRKVVLDRLSLTLPAGSKVGVLGRNGAGKSTLLGMIAGIVRPDAGSIRCTEAISWPLGLGGSFHPPAHRRPERALRGADLRHGYRRADRLRRRLRRDRRVHEHAGAHLFQRHEGPARLRHVDGHRLRLVPHRRADRGRRQAASRRSRWRCSATASRTPGC